MYDGKDVRCGGRSDNAQLPYNLVEELDMMFKSHDSINIFPGIFGVEEDTQVTLYGEGYGAKIQKGGGNYIPDGVSFVLFDVLINGIWLERKSVEDIAEKFGIKVVPIIGHGTLDEAIEKTKKGFKSQWGDFTAEGIVARPTVEVLTRRGERLITKVKYKDFN